MDHYKIVYDETALLDFINWLPELKANQKFMVALFARKKYDDSIKSSDKTQLKRFTANKKTLYNKIKALEIPMGYWKLKDNTPVSQRSLVLYIMPNPRCMKKATEAMGKACWDLMKSENYNPDAEVMSCIQRAKSESIYVDFDIDDKTIDLSMLNNIFPQSDTYKCYDILETRGGYHILVNPKKASKAIQLKRTSDKKTKNWYNEIKKRFNVDQCGDQFIPVPGCCQGDFIPKML